MSNSIQIKACDNQLVLLAVNNDGGSSYEICNIQSGNTNLVDLDLSVQAGTYTGTLNLNGVNGSLQGQHTVSLPSGKYALVYSGTNWGGPYNFDIEVNGQPFQLKNDPSKPLTGAIWNRGDLEIQLDV